MNPDTAETIAEFESKLSKVPQVARLPFYRLANIRGLQVATQAIEVYTVNRVLFMGACRQLAILEEEADSYEAKMLSALEGEIQ